VWKEREENNDAVFYDFVVLQEVAVPSRFTSGMIGEGTQGNTKDDHEIVFYNM